MVGYYVCALEGTGRAKLKGDPVNDPYRAAVIGLVRPFRGTRISALIPTVRHGGPVYTKTIVRVEGAIAVHTFLRDRPEVQDLTIERGPQERFASLVLAEQTALRALSTDLRKRADQTTEPRTHREDGTMAEFVESALQILEPSATLARFGVVHGSARLP